MRPALLSCGRDDKRAMARFMPRIAICAPATPLKRELADAVTRLAEARFPELELIFHSQCFMTDSHFAGSDEVRVAALLECANDPDFDAVWFAKGGYGSNRIIDAFVNGAKEPAYDKIYLGYSDCGFLLGALHKLGIGQSVHAPMPVDIGRDGGEDAVARTLAFLSGDMSGLEPNLDDRPTLAFNLATLSMMIGMEHMPDHTGHVVIVEEVAEHHYAIDRMFWQITNNLAGCAGIRLGEVTSVPENDRPFGRTAEEIAQDWCMRSGIPYLRRAQIGHSINNHIVPFKSPV